MHKDPHKALLVGAYERDNFGDILFLLLTEKYLARADVTAAAPMHADMSHVFGRYIPAYAPLLKTARWDSVWSVGGELGRVSLPAALNYSLSDDMRVVYKGQDREGQRAIRKALSSDVDHDLVYVPTMHEYPLNYQANLIINSAGLSGMASFAPNIERRYLRKVRAAKVINVRDQKSSDYLTSHGIEHEVVPDLVHAISRLYPDNDVGSGAYICVHTSAGYLNSVGYEEFANRLIDLANGTKLNIMLFLAGTAPGHDSVDAYREVARLAANKEPDVSIQITENRDPLYLVEVILRSRAWVGTSLHGRIVAESYGVPRVSLSKSPINGNAQEKTAVYAATWDSDMPYAVTLKDMVGAVKESMAQPEPGASDGLTALARLAHESMERTVAAALTGQQTTAAHERPGTWWNSVWNRTRAISARLKADL
ncbi:polysaccharide pyruvyl transferase family protein [Arthrobacter pigmenti]